MNVYVTRSGETVDLACHRFYGRTAQVTEAVLAANRGVAALGPVLPVGTVLKMPPAPEPEARKLVKLYE